MCTSEIYVYRERQRETETQRFCMHVLNLIYFIHIPQVRHQHAEIIDVLMAAGADHLIEDKYVSLRVWYTYLSI